MDGMTPRKPCSGFETHNLRMGTNFFNKLPGSVRSPPGLEHRIWRRLPVITLWGTLLPVLLMGLNHAFAPLSGRSESATMLWDYTMIGIVVLHWTLVLTVAIGCFIVRVMKGPGYVADAFPPEEAIKPRGLHQPGPDSRDT